MERSFDKVKGGKLTLTFTLAPEEVAGFERRALELLATKVNIDGFRPGKAPANLVRERVGAEALLEETLQQAVRQLYPAFVREQSLEVVGRPELTKFTPQPFSFELTAPVIPEVKLGKWQKNKFKRKVVVVSDDEVKKVIDDVRDSRASEAAVTRAAKLGDRVEMDFEVSSGGVVIDGGKGTQYPVVLGHRQLVAGFEEQVVSMEPGATKEFDFTFPTDYRKDLAGKPAHGKVKLSQVFERTLPELNDEFAKNLGKFENVAGLLAKLKENMVDERREHEEERVEREMLESLVATAEFGDIPEVLMLGELDKMVHEFRHSMEERGVAWVDYLTSIGRDEAKLREDFKTPAEKRVKVALITRAFAKAESLEADDIAVQNEIAKAIEHHNGDERVVAQANSEDYRDYVKNVLTNRKVIAWLKEKLVE